MGFLILCGYAVAVLAIGAVLLVRATLGVCGTYEQAHDVPKQSRRRVSDPFPSSTRLPEDYRSDLVATVVLADGGSVQIRPILPSDLGLLQLLHRSLSDETVRLRFFGPRRELPLRDFEHFVTVDYIDRLAIVAVVDGELVAVARYDRPPGGIEAEVAFVVRDDHQKRGLGTLLLRALASAAQPVEISRLVADTLPENHPMLDVFRHAGFPEHAQLDRGVVRVKWILRPQSVPARARAAQAGHGVHDRMVT